MKKIFILLLSIILIFSSCTSTKTEVVEEVPAIATPAPAPVEQAVPEAAVEAEAPAISGTIIEVSKYGNTYLDTTTAELLEAFELGEEFILEASKELTPEIKEEIEIIARLAFDEDDSTLLEVSDCDTTDELLELSVFDIAGLLAKKIESDLQISVTFKPIELEVTINY